jgi:membrane protein DedA with SNARE-associated domain
VAGSDFLRGKLVLPDPAGRDDRADGAGAAGSGVADRDDLYACLRDRRLLRLCGRAIVDFYGLQDPFAQFQHQFQEWGLWIILIKGMTPIPYKLVTIASGVAHFDLLVFALASFVTRGIRFFLVAALLKVFGEPIRTFIERYLTLVTTAVVLLIVAGFVAIKYV